MCIVDDHFAHMIHFLTTRTTPEGYSTQQKKELVVCIIDFSIIVGHLYKMGTDEILHQYVRSLSTLVSSPKSMVEWQEDTIQVE